MLAWNGGQRRRVSGSGARSASSLQSAFFAQQSSLSEPSRRRQSAPACQQSTSAAAAASLLVLGADAAPVCELDQPLRGPPKSKADRSRNSSRSVGVAGEHDESESADRSRNSSRSIGGVAGEESLSVVLPPGSKKRPGRRSSAEGLPAGWVATVSRNTGKTYYRHRASGKTVTPAKFIIFNAKFLVFDTQFLVLNTKFLGF